MTYGKIFLFLLASMLIAYSSEFLLVDTIYYKWPSWYPFINSYVPGLLAIMVVSWPLIKLQALLHAAKIKANIRPIHWKANVLRFFISLGLCSLFHFMTWDVWKVGTLMLFSFCWFGIVFNFKLNRYRGLNPFYVGIPDKKDSPIDTIFFSLFGRAKVITLFNAKVQQAGIALFICELIGIFLTGWIYAK